MVESKLSSNHDEGASMEARFSDLCKATVSLDETMRMQATVLFRETKHILLANMAAIGTGSPEEIEKIWSAFVLYSVARLSQETTEVEERNRLTLSQVLRASELKSVDFFKEMPQFSLKTGHILSRIYGSDWEKRLGLEELQTSIGHLSHLSRYFTRAYRDFFLSTDTSSSLHSAVSRIAGYVSDYHQFGWLFFLSLRMHAFGRFKDLVTCTNGLVSIVAILIIHVPVRFRNFTIQNSPSFAKRSGKGINLLGSLCDIYHTSEDELRRTMGQVNSLIIDILKKKPCPVSECKSETLGHINPDGLMYFADLLEENSVVPSLLVLEKSYDDAISTRGELDERLFLSNDDNSLSSVSSSGCGIGISGSKRKFDTFASPSKTITNPISPLCSPTPYVNGNFSGNSWMPAATPVTTAMTTAKWLRDFISPLPPKPSSDLVCFLSSCDRDVTSDVTHRAIIILEAIFPSFGERCISRSWEIMSLVDSTWAEQRKMEALKLYYRVLEAVCRAESHILNGNNLTSLLSNERFHRCMIACSAELVLTTYKTITLTFPAVLEKTGITSFDLCKVIECFVRHEETLPRELKRHLNSLEERLLESMVWEKGSSIYNSLIVAKPTLSSDIKRLGLLAEPLPSLDSIAMYQSVYNGRLPPLPSKRCETSPDQNGDGRSPKRICGEYRSVLVERNSFRSPMKERLLYPNGLKSKILPLQSVFSSPARPNSAGGETCAEAGLSVFFNKVLKLAAIRIRSLCERLDLSQQILEHIYRLIQQILNQQTALLFNRHIDQLILCSLYGVVKISQLSLTFKEIINSYKKQPQCKPQVFRSVFVDWPSTRHNGKTGQEHVDIITFYNEVFIPSVKPLLVELGPAGCILKNNTCPEDKDNVDGQIPESPRLSSFPKLPDMTPKKVSPAHNVYVSPLQSSKMDSLLSPSSKSYYACVGESTHTYQSPSNDLTVINNRLKCGRRMINFDMVSDSVVAGTLYQQIGSSAVKCEKPDF